MIYTTHLRSVVPGRPARAILRMLGSGVYAAVVTGVSPAVIFSAIDADGIVDLADWLACGWEFPVGWASGTAETITLEFIPCHEFSALVFLPVSPNVPVRDAAEIVKEIEAEVTNPQQTNDERKQVE